MCAFLRQKEIEHNNECPLTCDTPVILNGDEQYLNILTFLTAQLLKTCIEILNLCRQTTSPKQFFYFFWQCAISVVQQGQPKQLFGKDSKIKISSHEYDK